MFARYNFITLTAYGAPFVSKFVELGDIYIYIPTVYIYIPTVYIYPQCILYPHGIYIYIPTVYISIPTV